jgi:molybdopterin-guanine dinucleotide biosynthesis protein A
VAARHAGRLHGVCAVWPVGCLARLRDGVAQGRLRSLRSAFDHLGGTICDIDGGTDAFFNVNTPEELARAEILAKAANA